MSGKGSIHHVGEWESAVFTLLFAGGGELPVPFVGRDVESAGRCIRFSLALITGRHIRPVGPWIGGQG